MRSVRRSQLRSLLPARVQIRVKRTLQCAACVTAWDPELINMTVLINMLKPTFWLTEN